MKKILLTTTFLPTVLGACVALFSPKNVLDAWPLMQAGVDVMVGSLPGMAERVAASKISQVLAAAYLIYFISIPMQFVSIYVYSNNVTSFDMVSNLKKKGRSIFGVILISCAFFLMSLFYYFVLGVHNFNYLGIDPLNTRIGVAFIGIGFPMMSVSLIFALKLTYASIVLKILNG